ncbi:unnamed protein product [Boreogadus saida]
MSEGDASVSFPSPSVYSSQTDTGCTKEAHGQAADVLFRREGFCEEGVWLLENRKLEVFKEDLQGECANFPTVKEVQGERDQTPFVDFVDKLIVNFSKRFDSFSFGQQLTLFIQNPFLITDMRGFTQEVKQLFSPDLKPWQEKLELISHTEQER